MHAIDIVDDLMVILDEDGHGIDAHELRSYRGARRQVQAWAAEFAIDVADAYKQLREYFVACRDEEARR